MGSHQNRKVCVLCSTEHPCIVKKRGNSWSWIKAKVKMRTSPQWRTSNYHWVISPECQTESGWWVTKDLPKQISIPLNISPNAPQNDKANPDQEGSGGWWWGCVPDESLIFRWWFPQLWNESNIRFYFTQLSGALNALGFCKVHYTATGIYKHLTNISHYYYCTYY